MHRVRSLAFFSVCLAMALSVVATASARPTTWKQMEVTVHLEQSGGMMLVSGELPDSVKLPAEAELSVPAGSTLQWIGEILGGDPAADPELKYSTSRWGSSDVYRFKLATSREAQIEVPLKSAVVYDGTNYKPSIAWTATQDAPTVRMSVRVPANAAIVQAVDGAQLLPGDKDYRFYTRSFTGVKSGDELKLAFSYTLSPAAAGGSAATSSRSTGQVMVLLAGIIGAIAFVLFVRHKASQGSRFPWVGPAASAPEVPAVAPAARRQRSTRADDLEEAGDEHPASEEPESLSGSRRRLSGTAKRNIVTAGLIGTVVLVALLMSNQATRPKAVGETVSQTFSQDAPCATATIALSVPPDADPSKTAESVFGALSAVKGMNTATYNTKTGTLEAGFCESKTTETTVRQALAAAGLLADATSD